MTSRSLIDMNHYLEQGPTYEGHSSFVNQIPFIIVPTSQSSGPTYEGHCSFVNQISFIIVPTSQNSGPTKELRPQEFPLIGTSPQNYDQEMKVIVLFSVKYHLSQLLWSQFFFQSMARTMTNCNLVKKKIGKYQYRLKKEKKEIDCNRKENWEILL